MEHSGGKLMLWKTFVQVLYMAGIILTLLAIVAAIGFALCPNDAAGQCRSEWRDSVPEEAMRIRPLNKLPDERRYIER
jgi:hypothetical protein